MVFIVEMGLKLSGWVPGYWADGGTLDGVIVSLSIVEMLITVLLADTGVNISFCGCCGCCGCGCSRRGRASTRPDGSSSIRRSPTPSC